MDAEKIARDALRLECIKIAATQTAPGDEVVDIANDLYKWIVKKDDDSSESK